MNIEIFTLGGTIDKIYFDRKSTYQVGEPTVMEILQAMHVNFDRDGRQESKPLF